MCVSVFVHVKVIQYNTNKCPVTSLWELKSKDLYGNMTFSCLTVLVVCVCVRLDRLVARVTAVAFMDTCLCLCSRVKELKRAREHETPQKSPLAM